jgi:hypothetical protein
LLQVTLVRAFAYALLVLATATSARADEGESAIGITVMPEVAWLSHPLTAEVSPFTPTGTFSFLPRLGAGLSYGLTDSLTLGFGVDTAGFFGLNAVGTQIENTVGNIATGTYFDVMAPLSLAYRVDSGYDASGAIELSAGPCVAAWLANKALNPEVLGENGLPTEFPIVIDDQYRFGAFGRLSVFFTGRLFNWVVADVGLSTTVAWHETLAVHAGLLVRPSFILPLTPL